MKSSILKSPPDAVGSVRIGRARPAPAEAMPKARADGPTLRAASALPPPAPPDQAEGAARELEALRTAARAAGHAEGRATAQREFAALEHRLKTQVTQALTGLNDAHQRLRQDLEHACFDIAFAATVKVFGLLSVDPQAVTHAVRQTLAQAGNLTDLTIGLHPSDFQTLSGLADGSVAQSALCIDPSVSLGGCILRSAQGDIDARIETQLQSLAELLQQHRDAPPMAEHPEALA